MRHLHSAISNQTTNALGGFEKRVLPHALTKLQDLIVPGPVERGFYVASGGWDLVRQVQENLVDLLWKYSLRQQQDAGVILNEMKDLDSSHYNLINKSGCSVQNDKLRFQKGRFRTHRRASQIGQIIWVDSGNIFDAYHMAVAARKRGLEPIRVLRAVKVGRPFTAFQFQQMLDRVPNAALWARQTTGEQARQTTNEQDHSDTENAHAGACPPAVWRAFSRSLSLYPEKEVSSEVRSPSSVWWTPLVIISDLMGLFYDSELPEDDLHRAFREFLVRLSHLKERAIVLAVLMNHDVPPTRRHLLPEVLRLARRVSTRED